MIKGFIKKLIKIVDDCLETNLYGKATKVNQSWYNSAFLNRIRRCAGFAAVRWKYRMGIEDKNPLRLHLGCGHQHLEGYINIDCGKTRATDLVCDIRKLPYEDGSVKIIESYHVFEHFPVCLHAIVNSAYGEKYAALICVLEEWKRVLKESGRLVIEMPDLDGIVKEYLNADETKKEELLIGIYGSYRFNDAVDTHRWGANEYRLRYILKKAGFKNITFKETQDYHKEFCPCLRVEAFK